MKRFLPTSRHSLQGRALVPFNGEVPIGCQSLYARDASSGTYRAVATPDEAPVHTAKCGRPLFAGATPDGSIVIFQSEAALTANAHEASNLPPTRQRHENGGSGQQYGEQCMFGCDLYEASGGHLRLVNVLPGGEVAPNAIFGGYPGAIASEEVNKTGDTGADFSNAISTDSTRIFWTDTEPGTDFEHVFVLEDQSTTVQVSGPGQAEYWTATPDGRYAFYSEGGELWQFDTLTNTRTPITTAGAGVVGVLGTNQTGADGSYIYFVADQALASGAKARICKSLNKQRRQAEIEHEEGILTDEQFENIEARIEADRAEERSGRIPLTTGCNLYLLHEGRTSLIAVLSPQDNEFQGGGLTRQSGDWQANLGERTAQVTPDGRHLVLESRYPLTGYHNLGPEGTTITEVFSYSADDERLSCASCDPAGSAPKDRARAGAGEGLSMLPVSLEENTYMHRWISSDGNRVFFDSIQPLTASDVNTKQDVYEWEREATPGCPSATSIYGGCIYLLSGGTTEGYSFLVDADASGDNVFFEHTGPLGTVETPFDRNELYDARVAGGFPSSSSGQCSGPGCQGPPPTAAAFPPPPTTSFAGSGNYPPLPPAQTYVRPLTRAQKLVLALKACRKKRAKHKRSLCERQARKHYGATREARKSTARTRPRGGTR